MIIISSKRWANYTMEKHYYTYMVRCNDGSLYTGFTTDVVQRVEAHNEGRGAKYTKARLPVILVWFLEWDSEHTARSMEYRIKQLTKKQKEEIILGKGDILGAFLQKDETTD